MTPEQHIAALDERINRLEALLRQALCKCIVGSTTIQTDGCPLHHAYPYLPDIQQILRDQRGEWRNDSQPRSCA